MDVKKETEKTNKPNEPVSPPPSQSPSLIPAHSFNEYAWRRSRMTERGLMGGQVPYVDTDEGWEYD